MKIARPRALAVPTTPQQGGRREYRSGYRLGDSLFCDHRSGHAHVFRFAGRSPERVFPIRNPGEIIAAPHRTAGCRPAASSPGTLPVSRPAACLWLRSENNSFGPNKIAGSAASFPSEHVCKPPQSTQPDPGHNGKHSAEDVGCRNARHATDSLCVSHCRLMAGSFGALTRRKQAG